MTEAHLSIPLMILLVGVAIAVAILMKSCMERIGFPHLVGYLVLGFLLRLADSQWNFLSAQGQEIFEFLAEIGIITLLFRVGLESDLAGLMQQLPKASIIWVGNMLLSWVLGFLTAFYWLGLSLITSLFVSIALTATSVGVSVKVWQEREATKSENGELLLDVAEMDDISGVILMALLFAVAPALHQAGASSLWGTLGKTSGEFFLKALVFGALCFVFSRYLERGFSKFFRKIESPPDPMLEIVGTGFIIAAIAGLLGFSVAIGGFFAGLVFSNDPQSVKIDASFDSLYELFTPFFFIGIGLKIDPTALIHALGMGAILLIPAILGKIIGAGVPALLTCSVAGATLLGVSMVPRAEITLIVMERGLRLGNWAVSQQVFAAMVVVAAVTSIAAPIAVRSLLDKWPQTEQGQTEQKGES